MNIPWSLNMLCDRNMPGFWICQGYTSFWIPIYYLNKCTTIHLTRKFPFWVFQRCSPAHFEYKESFGKSWVKITEWSVWLKNFHFGYLKGAHLYYGFSFYLFYAWYLHVLCICFNLGTMFCGQNLSKKREWYLRLEKFQVK